MHDCYICEKKLFCSLDREVHKSWLKQLRLSNIRKFLLVSSNKGGLGVSTLSNFLAYEMNKNSYKVGLIEMSYNGNFLRYLSKNDTKEMTLSTKGIEAVNTRFDYFYTSPSLFVENTSGVINWDIETNFKILKNLILNTDWQGIDLMILDIPFYMLDLIKFLKSYLGDKFNDAILILDYNNLKNEFYNINFINYVKNFTNILSILTSPCAYELNVPKYLKDYNFNSLNFVNEVYSNKFLPTTVFDKTLKENEKLIKELSELCIRIF
jgi:hypothetical protein